MNREAGDSLVSIDHTLGWQAGSGVVAQLLTGLYLDVQLALPSAFEPLHTGRFEHHEHGERKRTVEVTLGTPRSRSRQSSPHLTLICVGLAGRLAHSSLQGSLHADGCLVELTHVCASGDRPHPRSDNGRAQTSDFEERMHINSGHSGNRASDRQRWGYFLQAGNL